MPEARRLIISSLWTTSRLGGRAARDYSFETGLERQHLDGLRGRAARSAEDIYRRLNAVEQLFALPGETGVCHATAHCAAKQPLAVHFDGIEQQRAVALDLVVERDIPELLLDDDGVRIDHS